MTAEQEQDTVARGRYARLAVYPQGKRCDRCSTTEARCAYAYPYCGQCVHTFEEGIVPSFRVFQCGECGWLEHRIGQGRPRSKCVECGWRKPC